MNKKWIITALFLSMSVTTVYAHKGATGVVKERMDAMSSIGKNLKNIFLMMKGKTEFDAKIIASSSREISIHAEKFPKMFPKGSTSHPSEAAPAIWERPDDFAKQAQSLTIYTSELTKIAENNSDQVLINTAFQKLATTCKSCHTEFRIKK